MKKKIYIEILWSSFQFFSLNIVILSFEIFWLVFQLEMGEGGGAAS